MTGVVLALAGLTAADAGPSMGAATAPVTVRLVGEWTGTERVGEGGPKEAELSAGTLTTGPSLCGTYVRAVCFVSTDGRGRTRAAWGGVGFRVSWRQEGRAPPTVRLRGLFYVPGVPEAFEIVITLRPATPSKP